MQWVGVPSSSIDKEPRRPGRVPSSTHKHNLIEGLDEIGLTLQNADAIKAYEAQRQQQTPWLFA